jgi:ABC-2 type transport system permease protein
MLRANLRVILTTFELYLKQQAVDLFIVFTVLVQPILIAILGIYVLRDEAASNAIYIVVGSGMTGLWSGLLFTSAFNIRGERWFGTLEMLVGSPTPLYVIVMGKTLSSVLLSLTSMIFGYFVAALLFRFPLIVVQPLQFVISLALTVVAYVALGMVIAPFMSINLSMERWTNALEFPIYIVGGFLFPILLLPRWTNPVSYALAPYWAARALHGTSSGGAPWGEVLFAWLMLLVFSLIYMVVSAKLFQIVLRRARVDATLGLQ